MLFAADVTKHRGGPSASQHVKLNITSQTTTPILLPTTTTSPEVRHAKQKITRADTPTSLWHHLRLHRRTPRTKKCSAFMANFSTRPRCWTTNPRIRMIRRTMRSCFACTTRAGRIRMFLSFLLLRDAISTIRLFGQGVCLCLRSSLFCVTTHLARLYKPRLLRCSNRSRSSGRPVHLPGPFVLRKADLGTDMA